MAKKRAKTDFTDQHERREQLRAYLARKEAERRQRLEAGADAEEKQR